MPLSFKKQVHIPGAVPFPEVGEVRPGHRPAKSLIAAKSA
jgi:hypothetical protein